MARVALPWRWSDLANLGTSWNWEEGRITFLHEIRGGDRFGWNHRIAERNPTNGILLTLLQSQCVVGRVTQVRSPRLSRQFANLGPPALDGSEHCVVGHPEKPMGVEQFLDFVRQADLFSAITIKPPEVVPDTTSTPFFWTHVVLWLGSAVFGGLLGVPCNVATRCNCRFGRIRQTPTWISTETLRDAYHRFVLTTGDGTEGAKRIIPHGKFQCSRRDQSVTRRRTETVVRIADYPADHQSDKKDNL